MGKKRIKTEVYSSIEREQMASDEKPTAMLFSRASNAEKSVSRLGLHMSFFFSVPRGLLMKSKKL
jgi:hypothetical protein